jgi:CRISPR/Cas system-associated exonuclease Cas4 (RecB family)
MKVDYIRASWPGSFNICPFKWHCQQICVTEKETTGTRKRDLGTLVHGIIEDYFGTIALREAITTGDIEYIAKTKFSSHWDENKHDFPRLYKRTKRNIDNFISIEQRRLKTWKNYQPTTIEKQLYSGPFSGKMDWYSETEHAIIDWKTSDTSYLSNSMLIQGSIYKILAERNNMPVKKVFFALTYPGLLLEMPPQTMNWLKKELSPMVKMLKEDDFPRKKSGICKTCGYTDHCGLSNGGCLWKTTL